MNSKFLLRTLSNYRDHTADRFKKFDGTSLCHLLLFPLLPLPPRNHYRLGLKVVESLGLGHTQFQINEKEELLSFTMYKIYPIKAIKLNVRIYERCHILYSLYNDTLRFFYENRE